MKMPCELCNKETLEDELILIDCSWFVCPSCDDKHDEEEIINIIQDIVWQINFNCITILLY